MPVYKKAKAKINLNLVVTGQRADGYHLLSSFFVFTEFGDDLSFDYADSLSLKLVGPFANSLTVDAGNSVLKAARGLAKLCGCEPKVCIMLNKQIPVAAGLGGGTADAAATLQGLCELWNVAPNRQDLYNLAVSLGADVPASLNGKSAMVEGIGDVLLPAPVINQDVFVILVNPLVSVATGQIFSLLKGIFSTPFAFKDRYKTVKELADDLKKTGNDLYPAAIKVKPVISKVLDEIRGTKGCLFAGMSGSGATCFGIYETKVSADFATNEIRQQHPDWWICESNIEKL